MPIPSCQDTKMPAFLPPGTSLPGILVPGIWQCGVILLRARGHLDNMVPFPPFSPSVGAPQKASKIVLSWLHAATQPKCHETILFATFAPCWHGTKNIKKSTFWHPKIDIFGASVHILASWSARMPIPSCQEAKMPAFLVSWCQDTWLPGTWYLAVWSNTVRARGHLANLVGFPWSAGNAQNH